MTLFNSLRKVVEADCGNLLQMPEEDTFAVLVKIMQDYRMREMFKPSMAELGLCMYQLDVLVQEHIPDLSAHFQVTRYACNYNLT